MKPNGKPPFWGQRDTQHRCLSTNPSAHFAGRQFHGCQCRAQHRAAGRRLPRAAQQRGRAQSRHQQQHIRLGSFLGNTNKWLWVKNRVTPKWNPGEWKHGLKPAVPWWLNFDSYPNKDRGHGPSQKCQAFPSGNELLGEGGSESRVLGMQRFLMQEGLPKNVFSKTAFLGGSRELGLWEGRGAALSMQEGVREGMARKTRHFQEPGKPILSKISF